MKKLLLTTSIVALSICGALAGDGKSFKEVKTVVTPEPPCRFRDMEFQVDAFYTHFWGDDGSVVRKRPRWWIRPELLLLALHRYRIRGILVR